MAKAGSRKQIQKGACSCEEDVSLLTPNLTMEKQAWLPPQPSGLHWFNRQKQTVLGVLGSRVMGTALQAPFPLQGL